MPVKHAHLFTGLYFEVPSATGEDPATERYPVNPGLHVFGKGKYMHAGYTLKRWFFNVPLMSIPLRSVDFPAFCLRS